MLLVHTVILLATPTLATLKYSYYTGNEITWSGVLWHLCLLYRLYKFTYSRAVVSWETLIYISKYSAPLTEQSINNWVKVPAERQQNRENKNARF